MGFEAKYLNQRTRGLAKVKAGTDHAGIVEHHQGALRHIVGKPKELAVRYLAAAPHEQFRAVALGQRVLGYALIGQGIGEVFNANIFG